MKQFIKTIMLVAFAVLFVPAFAQAQSFNNTSQDLGTVLVANHTTGGCGANDGAGCWKSAVTANPGDTISVQVYYHNTGSSTVNNVSLSLSPQNTTLGSSATFSGGVVVNGSRIASGSATVNFSGNQTLTFIPGSVRWFPNQADYGQSVSLENRLFTNAGIPIGDVGPGWSEQGTMVASFKVSNNSTSGGSTGTTCNLSLSASSSSIYYNDQTTLYWSANNCTNVNINPVVGTVYGTSGSYTVRPYGTTTYTITGQGDNGVSQAQATVYVNNNNYNSCSVSNFYPDTSSITRGQNTILRWNTNADYVTIYPGITSNGNSSGSAYVSPSTSTTYTISTYCNNRLGDSRSTTVNVSNSSTSSLQVTTTAATEVRSTTARINGVTNPNNNGTAIAWFEYGTTGALGNRTAAQTVPSGSASFYNDYLTGLTPNTWYYYRSVLQNQSGTVQGDIERVKTASASTGGSTTTVITKTVKPVQIVNNTVVAQSAPSLLELKVNSQYDRMCVNGNMQYVVTYRNISGVTLKDTVLRITHPKELTFIAATQGHYEVVDRALTIDVGEVAPNQQGIVTLTLKVNNDAVRGNLAVTTATVVYTNPETKGQEDATAYSLINVSDDCPTANTLGASAFGTSFLPDTLLEWLLLILIILALILIARQLYKKSHQA